MATSETLRSVIDAGRTAKRLDELSTARVIGKIAEQLHASQHKAGSGKAIGPITPAGIGFEPGGAAKLGLAEPAAVTYSSPEQITEDVGDRRSDVFSLGTVMWEALTHEPLFADAVEVKTKPIVSPSEFNANIPAELGVICMKALARNPVDRYQSAKVMAAEIEAVLEEAGYADTDERIGEYLAELGKPQALPKVTLLTPPGGLTAPTSLLTGQPARLNDTLPSLGAPLPPVLPAKPTDPPKNKPIPKFVEAKLAEARAEDVAESAPTEKFERVDAHPFTAQPVEAPKLEARLVEDGPLPSVLPGATLGGEAKPKVEAPKPLPAPNLDAKPRVELPKLNSSATVLGFASAAATETVSPKPEPAVLATPPVEPSPAASDPILLATPKSALPEPLRPKPSGTSPAPTSPPSTSPAAAPIHELPKVASAPVPAAAIVREGSKPNPAAVVALPRRDSTGTVELLGGWGWGTDSHEAISDDDAYDDKPPRKILLYVIGGGVGLAALVTIIAIGFGGGSSKKPAPQPAPAVQEAMQPPGSAAGSAVQTVVATGTPSAGASATGDVASAADVIAALPADAAVAEVTPPAIDAAVAVVPPDAAAVVVAPPPPPPPPPAPKPEPPRHHETPVAAHHAEPPRVAHAEPPSHPRMSQGDVDAAYKQGLQLYMRGDTEGALASLRAALSGNPGYPPTWRGLGLVYEKLGEKDQARAAYRKYLQLAPSAGDADKIRNRLERL